MALSKLFLSLSWALLAWLGAASVFYPSDTARLPFPPIPRGYLPGPSRFSLETAICSSFSSSQSDGKTLDQGNARFFATIGYAPTSNALLRVTLGYDLMDWRTGGEARWGQGLSLSNIKGASFEMRMPGAWALQLRYGEDQESLSSFHRLSSRWFDGEAPGSWLATPDSLSLGLSKSMLGDRLRLSVQVVSPELGLRKN
ncbi:MAG: hypothetical protein J0L75_01255 [Spirochaetes bacterium]|nr:hypothetical protein [Spirochaetota bacterium]